MSDPFGNDGTPTVWNKEDGSKVYPGETFHGDFQGSISAPHLEIHEGEAYRACAIVTADQVDIVITIGAVKNLHLWTAAGAAEDANMFVYEAPTFDPDGTPMTAYNRNRESSETTSASLIQLDPTVTVVGIGPIECAAIFGGSGPQASGGAFSSRLEWVLKRSTSYLIRILSLAGSQRMNPFIEWYEHLPVEGVT